MLDQTFIVDGKADMDKGHNGIKPRQRNLLSKVPSLFDVRTKRGRGAKKVVVVGIASSGRGREIVTKTIAKLSTLNLLQLNNLSTKIDLSFTDEVVKHLTVDHITSKLLTVRCIQHD